MQFYINYLILHNQSSSDGICNPLFNTFLLQLAVLGAHYRICKKYLFIRSYIKEKKLAGPFIIFTNALAEQSLRVHSTLMVPSAANTSRDFNQRERYLKAFLPQPLSNNCENVIIFKDQSISLLVRQSITRLFDYLYPYHLVSFSQRKDYFHFEYFGQIILR